MFVEQTCGLLGREYLSNSASDVEHVIDEFEHGIVGSFEHLPPVGQYRQSVTAVTDN